MAKQELFYDDVMSPQMQAYYRDHWVECIYDVICADVEGFKLEPEQIEIIEAIQDNKRVSSRSGKGIGKTAVVSLVIITFMLLYPESTKCVVTAPGKPQIESALWPELYKWLSKNPDLMEIFEYTATKFYLKENPQGCFCVPRTASKGAEESLQGLHEDNMLLLADEASAVSDNVIEKFITTCSKPNNKVVLISNPTRTSGIFFESHQNKYQHQWKTLHFDASQSAICDKELHEYLELRYGKDSDVYKVSVLGEFPSGSPDVLIQYELVKAAMYREVKPERDDPIVIGLDCARFGDDNTVLCWRWGKKVYPLEVYANTSTDQIVTKALALVDKIREGKIDKLTTGYEKKIKIYVDGGGLGAGPVDYLNLDRTHNIEVVECNFGGAGDDMYANEATIMWVAVRDAIESVQLPDDEFLLEELSSRKYGFTKDNKLILQSKKEFKREYSGKSPDRADAVVLAFSRKGSARRVLPKFDRLDNQQVGIVPGYTMGETYCSVFYSKDLLASVLYMTWTGSKLVITDEFVSEGSIVPVSSNITAHGKLYRVMGNRIMFNDKGDDLSTQFMRSGISVYDNYRYDEYGAIQALSRLVSQKKLFVHHQLRQVIDQLTEWSLDTPVKEQHTKFGLCYALINVISDLKNSRKLEPEPSMNIIPSYTGEKSKELRRLATNKPHSSKKWLGL